MRLAVAVALLAACTGAPAPGEQRAAILGGSVASGDPAVGMLEFASGRLGTGTLIAPDVVLTAGHVVGGSITAFFTGAGVASKPLDNTTSSPTMVRHEIGEKLTHPSYGCSASGTCDATGWDLDVGLVRLAAPITDLVPYTLDATLPAVGDPCRTVGFGVHTAEGVTDYDLATVKQKREADVDVIAIEDTFVVVRWVTGIPDHGDSGGPLFCNGKLVATTTLRVDGELATHREEYDTRVDRMLPWIQTKLAEWAPPDLAPPADLAAAPSPSDGGCRVGAAPLDGFALLLLALVTSFRACSSRRHARFFVAVSEGLADVEEGRVATNDELGKILDDRFGPLPKTKRRAR